MSQHCTCIPCTTPAYGHPSYAHCAACCMGTMIANYDPLCPYPEHQELARRQHGMTPGEFEKYKETIQ